MTISVPFNSISGITPTNFTEPVPLTSGGTGKTSFESGYIKSDGTELNTSLMIPGTDVDGDISGNATNVNGVVSIEHGGTGQSSFTTGYIKSDGTTLSSSVTIPGSDVTGNISGKSSGIDGILPIVEGGTGQNEFTSGYIKSDGTNLLSSTTINGSDVTGDIPNNANNVNGIVSIEHGGTGQSIPNAALNALLPLQLDNQMKVLMTDGTDSHWMFINSEQLLGTTLPPNITTSSITRLGLLDSLAIAGRVAFGQSYTELVSNISSSSTVELDCSSSNIFVIPMAQNVTSLSFVNLPPLNRSYSMTLFLTQDAVGSRLITWPQTVKWADNVAPVLSTTPNKTDIFTLVTIDSGASWFGFVSGLNY